MRVLLYDLNICTKNDNVFVLFRTQIILIFLNILLRKSLSSNLVVTFKLAFFEK